jgi:alkylated DNA repair dioxygenase AlkB
MRGQALRESPELPSGLRCLPSFIQQGEADALLAFIDANVWDTGLKRRVQHYGWLYDYKVSRVNPENYLGPLPDIFAKMVDKISDELGKAMNFDQVIVNEYEPGQGISAHVDCMPCFGPVVAAISLGSPCEMVFQNLATRVRVSLILEPQSLLIISGESRSAWSHAIPARRSDIVEGTRLLRHRRVSLTFRTKI